LRKVVGVEKVELANHRLIYLPKPEGCSLEEKLKPAFGNI